MVTCMAKFLSMVLMQWKHWKPALLFAFRSQLHCLQKCTTYGLTRPVRTPPESKPLCHCLPYPQKHNRPVCNSIAPKR